MITTFYPKTIKSVTTALMDMFNDIKIVKYDSNGTSAEEFPVFIMFAPNLKAHQDRIENHYFDTSAVDLSGYTQVTEVNQAYFLSSPRLALTLDSLTYNPDRAYGVNEFRNWLQQSLELSATDLEQIFSDMQPSPWDFNYSLSIMTNSIDYFAQIMENILPYFNPKLYLRIKEFSFLNVERDLPVSIGGVPLDFSNDMGETDQRHIEATINLQVEGFLYKPWTQSKIIKVINSKYFIEN